MNKVICLICCFLASLWTQSFLYSQQLEKGKVLIMIITTKYNNDFLTEYYYLIKGDSILHVSPYFNSENTPCFLSNPDALSTKLIVEQKKMNPGIIKTKLDQMKYADFSNTGNKKYKYYWSCVNVYLEYYVIRCSEQKHVLSSITGGVSSFVPVSAEKIKRGKPPSGIMSKISKSLE